MKGLSQLVDKRKDTLLEILKPLLEKIQGILDSDINEKYEKKILADLVKAIVELQNDGELLNMLAITEKHEISDFLTTLTSSKVPDWESWKRDLGYLVEDLKGNFIFGSNAKEYNLNLNGSSLETVRILNKHYNLDMNLHNVGTIKLSRENTNSKIKVEIIDTFGNVMADWEEYKQTQKVSIKRLDSQQYRYVYEGKK